MEDNSKLSVHVFETGAHGAVQLVTGLEWLDGTDKQVVSDYLKDNQIKKPMKITLGDQVGVGSASGHKLGKHVCSVASLFSLYQEEGSIFLDNSDAAETNTWIIIEKFETGYWVGLINSGQVLSDSEATLSREEAELKSGELESFAHSENLTHCFVGGGLAEFLPEATPAATLEGILEWISPEDLKKQKLQATTIQDQVALIVIVAVLGFAAYKAAGYFGLVNSGPTPEEIHQQQVDAASQVVSDYYAQALSFPTLQQATNRVHTLISMKQLLDAPWQVNQMNCNIEFSSCQITYSNPENIPTSYIQEFLQSRCDSFEINPQGNAANCSLPLSFVNPEFSEPGGDLLPFTAQLMVLADIGFATEISSPQQSNIPGGEMAPPESYYKEGAWKISGSYVDAMNAMPGFHPLGWVKPKTIKITTDTSSQNQTALMIEGTYVIN